MKSKKIIFNLNLQKSKVAQLYTAENLKGGLRGSSEAKTFPYNRNCQSGFPTCE